MIVVVVVVTVMSDLKGLPPLRAKLRDVRGHQVAGARVEENARVARLGDACYRRRIGFRPVRGSGGSGGRGAEARVQGEFALVGVEEVMQPYHNRLVRALWWGSVMWRCGSRRRREKRIRLAAAVSVVVMCRLVVEVLLRLDEVLEGEEEGVEDFVTSSPSFEGEVEGLEC